jgi:hypothetical protein
MEEKTKNLLDAKLGEYNLHLQKRTYSLKREIEKKTFPTNGKIRGNNQRSVGD